jgi:hypothetical protein
MAALTPMYFDNFSRRQSKLAFLKKQYRNRHFAYCVVRRGEGSSKGPIFSPHTKVKLNVRLVDKYQVRLLENIVKAQSKYIDALILEKQKKTFYYKKSDSGFEESAPVPKETWDAITTTMKLNGIPWPDPPKMPDDLIPICVFYPDNGGERSLYAKDFRKDTSGNLIYDITESGKMYKPTDNVHFTVKPGFSIIKYAEGDPTPKLKPLCSRYMSANCGCNLGKYGKYPNLCTGNNTEGGVNCIRLKEFKKRLHACGFPKV